MVNAEVHVIDRGGLYCDMNYMMEANTIGSHDEPNPDTEYDEIPVWNLVIDHPEATILWDTGSHHDAADGHWPEGLVQAFTRTTRRDHRLDDDLEAAGYSLDDIDAVFQSHLHLDHAGGLEFFAGTDTPVYVHEEELKFAYYSAKTDGERRVRARRLRPRPELAGAPSTARSASPIWSSSGSPATRRGSPAR